MVEKFRKAWAREKRPHPEVDSIFKVTNSTLEKKWTTYRSRLIEKDVKELYHGTKFSCKITTTQKLCNIGNCGICGISSIGLDHQYIRNGFQKFGNGFYLAPNSSKCNDYAQSCDGLKAMFLCDVLPGKRYTVKTNRQHLEGPPTGYDSVYGNIGEDLNFDEQVVYKSEAVLPRYIIVYS
ncbi:MAG: hypothetical protein MJE68_24025 [Proteobacteria bacterium]|nr:hypothetical protein [Pseudomonadota bacterium]